MTMTVKVHVAPALMIVMMEMPPFTDQLHAEQGAQHDEHQSHEPFRCDRNRFWNRDAEHQDNGTHEQQDGGMAYSPAQTHQARRAPRRTLGEHSRNGGKMI